MISRRDALKLGAAGIIAPGVLQGCGAQSQERGSNVAMYGGNPARTGVMPGPGPDATTSITVKWHSQGYGNIQSPIVTDGVIYFGSLDGNVYALNAESGAEYWRTWANDSAGSTPAILNDVVFIGSSDGLHAFDKKDGSEIWTISNQYNDYGFTSPVVAGDIVYAQDKAGNLYAVDADSGMERWTFSGSGNTLSSPAYSSSSIYCSSRAWSSIHALDAESGDERWRFNHENGGDAFICVENDYLYASTEKGYVHCINFKDGAVKWTFQHAGDENRSAPAISDGIVYVGSLDGYLYALDSTTGAEVWRFSTGTGIESSPVLADEVVYVGSEDGYLYAIDTKTGDEHWRFLAEEHPLMGLDSSPFIIDGIIYLGGTGFFALGDD